MKSAIFESRACEWGFLQVEKVYFWGGMAEVYNNAVIVHGRALGLRYWQLPPARVGVKEKARVKEASPIVQLGYFH